MSWWTQPATCMPAGCFCEAIRAGGIAQPANFWSSLAFVVAAIAVWAAARDRYGRVYGLTLLAVGAGSAYYHASLTFAGQAADIAGMYAVATFAILLAAVREGRIPGRAFVGWFVAVNGALGFAQVEFPGARRYVFAALIAGVLMAERGGHSIHLRRAVAVLGAGFLFWAVDILKVICAPRSLIQGHAIWHVTGAVAGWMLSPHLFLRRRDHLV